MEKEITTVPEEAQIMCSKETAKYLGVSMSYLYKLTNRNKIPYYKPGGKRIYFDKAEINAWIKSNRITPQQEINDRANRYCVTHK